MGTGVKVETLFKEWAKPGPVPRGARAPVTVPADETFDAISGHFRIFQLRRGHRFSTDDLLTAWYWTAWAPSGAFRTRSRIRHRLGRQGGSLASLSVPMS